MKSTKIHPAKIHQEHKSEGSSILSPEGVIVLSWACMLDFAGLADLLDSIPAVGTVIATIITASVAVVGSLTLGIWAWMKTRGNFQRKLRKNALRQGIIFVLEAFIPFGSLIPGYIILVLVTYFSE